MPSLNRHALANSTPVATSVWPYGHAMFRKAGSDVAALALLQIVCFLILAHVEPRFVLIHFYQLIPYVALFLLIIHEQRRWAYMIGPLVSIGWLSIAYWAGLLSWAVEQLRAMEALTSTATLVALLAVITAVVAVVMTLRRRLRWVREYADQAQSYRTFFLCAGLVASYYWILIRWFWDVVGVHSPIPL